MRSKRPIPGLSLDDARARLPQVGDVLDREPTILGYGSMEERALRKCVVTYVNREHLWYEVEFTATGFRQGFKAIETEE